MSDIKSIKIGDKKYPELLKNIYDAPKELFIKGDVELLSTRCMAIVGTRRPTWYGRETSRKLARELAEVGLTIVSGLAEGIDTEAHIGALEAGGKTIAVFGCGLDTVFPPSNKKLARKIESSGSLVSELPAEHPTTKWTFPKRNRIISGLSMGVLMVEGDYDSGAMITAKLALDEGREVFAVPGNIDKEQSRGPNWLIKQGAKLIDNVDDILDEFNIVRIEGGSRKDRSDAGQLTIEESGLLKLLTREPKHIDELVALSGRETANVLGLLSIMEIKGLVRQLPGMYFVISG